MTNEDIKQSAELLSKFNLSKMDELMWLSAGLCGLLKDCKSEDHLSEVRKMMYKADKIEPHSYARGLWWYSLTYFLRMTINEISLDCRIDRNTIWKAVDKIKKYIQSDDYTKERWNVLKEHVKYGKRWVLQD